ncbi:MAG: B12 lower ligand biosynthesis radical SAM protein BzaD [Dissulfurispiraceae bacterium]
MRILMVQAPSVEGASQEKVYPIGIVMLAGRLESYGHEVGLLDMNIEIDPYSSLKQKALDFQPDAVGVSLRNVDPLGNKAVSLIPHFFATVRIVSSVLPMAWIFAGGTGFSLFPLRLMQELPEIHYGIVGEAEESLPALAASPGNPASLKGLCARKGNSIIIAPPSTDFDMADYSPPGRSRLDPLRYLNINAYVPAIGVETKRGCPYRCAYCVYPALQGRRLRCRRPASVVDEMETLHKEYGVGSFHFTDPVLNMPDNHLEEISREMLRRKLKIRWNGFIREDRLTEENVSLFERAGCECFSFSPDGLCQQSLDALGKGLGESDILEAARLVSRTDVLSVYHFMANVPGETEETCNKGVRFLEQLYELHSRKKNLGAVVLNNIRILPGTSIETHARAQGVITPETDLLYPVYYNPPPFDAFRYRLETLHFCKNIFMRQGIE